MGDPDSSSWMNLKNHSNIGKPPPPPPSFRVIAHTHFMISQTGHVGNYTAGENKTIECDN